MGISNTSTKSAPDLLGAVSRERGLREVLIGVSLILLTLNPLADSIADGNLALHMGQHFFVIAAAIVAGFGFEKLVLKHLLKIRRKFYPIWKMLAVVIKFNVRTKGIIVAVLIPIVVLGYWHFPQNFDLAALNSTLHATEHLSYILIGLSIGFSVSAIPKKLRIALLYLALMHVGMMGSIWLVSPNLYSIYGAQQNLTLDTSMMVGGAIGVLATSGFLLHYLDVI